jgi:hypothetical protein
MSLLLNKRRAFLRRILLILGFWRTTGLDKIFESRQDCLTIREP